MDNKPKLDESKLTSDQRDKLEKFKHDVNQLQALEDIASIAQDMHGLMEKDHQDPGRKTLIIDHVTGDDFVKILSNMNDAISKLGTDDKEEMPDYATPVVEAVRKLEAAINSAKPKDVAPVVNVAAPNVTVEPSSIDTSGIEKAVNAIPKAFAQAIKLIPKVEIPKTDNKDLLLAWEGISEQLVSIENATRMKPLPGSMKISNLTDINPESLTVKKSLSEIIQVVDASNTYIGQAAPGTNTAAAAWRIKKIVVSGDTTTIYWADGDGDFTKQWTSRATYSYVQ